MDKLVVKPLLQTDVSIALDTLIKEFKQFDNSRQAWEHEKHELKEKIENLEEECNKLNMQIDDLEKRNYLLELSVKRLNSNSNIKELETIKTYSKEEKKNIKSFTLPSKISTIKMARKSISTGRKIINDYVKTFGIIPKFNLNKNKITKSTEDDSTKKIMGQQPSSSLSNQTTYEQLTEENENLESKETPKNVLENPEIESKMKFKSKMLSTWNYRPRIGLTNHLDCVRSLDFHPSNPLMISSSRDFTVKLWDFDGKLNYYDKNKFTFFEPFVTLRTHKNMVTSAKIRETFCITASLDSQICYFPLSDDFEKITDNDVEYFQCHTDAIWALDVLPKSHNILGDESFLSAGADSCVVFWKDKKIRHMFYCPDDEDNPTSVCFQKTDNFKFFASHTSGKIIQYDLETQKSLRTFNAPDNTNLVQTENVPENNLIYQIIDHPQKSLLLSASDDSYLRFFDINSGKCVKKILAHSDSVTSVCHLSSLSMNKMINECVVTSSHDCSIRFWDLSTYKILNDLAPHQTHRIKYDEGIHCLAYSAEMEMVCSGGADSIVKVYT